MTGPSREVDIQPVVSWPHRVHAGETYLISVDLRLADPAAGWPYDEEELAVTCMIDGRPLCDVRALDDAGVVLHRFGGTYGPAHFLATAADPLGDVTGAAMWLTLTTAGGVPFLTVELPIDGSGALPGAAIPAPPEPPPGDPAPGAEITAVASVVGEPGTVEAEAPGEPAAVEAEAPGEPHVDRTWHQQAVFYDVLVQAFYDSNGDGWGDLRGLVERLDYLQWLGVDCLVLSPIFDSPWRDGGSDVRDFHRVHPQFGTVEDYVSLLDNAHRRGIRVVMTLTMNHTSDQHPWFQESARDPDGPYGDFYVWNDSRELYTDARVLLPDSEVSNWTFQQTRAQFYWHRFHAYEPDLNYDNPAVQEAVLDVLRFWLDLGTDGFRLEAAPFLFEREGTGGENLPETHAFLRHCRRVLDDEFPGRVLLLDTDQWPADLAEYFGDPAVGGDECHLAMHYPLAPRLFMAVRRESRFPISEILAQTLPIPAHGQWGIFLRNDDALALDLVPDEERDYMFAEFAKDPRMLAGRGIRRRLASLAENDRNQIQVLIALMLSLPGSPVLYYGDEIGMGDNIWLERANAVRTPMQWTLDRNGGFSTADQYKLFMPANTDARYGFAATSVEHQRDDPSSLMNWIRSMIAVRRRHEALSRGTFRELGGSNPSVLGYLRHHDDDVVLCVHNLSRFHQPVEFNLQKWAGYTPVELTGHVQFPRIGTLPYLLTVQGHGVMWFALMSESY